ncbi:putative Poly(U)-specific endoribonuclease [Hypsibius exemplaris]|uniref:Uridylate-specific endoribonuclease n=1 Tax=Hypsibius exemplaris TaxID=2072580 RepID=A0A1W0WNT4_HYPEX|nr:putative Poly(U)-specific endoribonuclease [Hypsibius exemplaris]
MAARPTARRDFSPNSQSSNQAIKQVRRVASSQSGNQAIKQVRGVASSQSGNQAIKQSSKCGELPCRLNPAIKQSSKCGEHVPRLPLTGTCKDREMELSWRTAKVLLGVVCLLAAFLFQASSAGSIISRIGERLGVGKGRSNNDEGATERPTMVDPELITLSEDLYKLDQARTGNAGKQQLDWTVNTRSSTGRLFTRMNDALLTKPTYAKFIALLDNYNPVLWTSEEVTPQERAEQSSFFRRDHRHSSHAESLDVPEISRFEHVFVGELDGGAPNAPVSGFHNWVRYYLEEKAGRAVFQRWKGQTDPDIYGLQFLWNGHPKIKSTMAVGESPEMSVAVLTTCFLTVPNNECKLRMGGAPVSVITHKWTTRSAQEFYVASAYYDS